MSKICDLAKKSDLSSYGWKVHRPQIEDTKNQDCYRFTDRFNICFTAEIRKKMSSLYAMFDDLKEHLKIKNHVLTKNQTEKNLL